MSETTPKRRTIDIPEGTTLEIDGEGYYVVESGKIHIDKEELYKSDGPGTVTQEHRHMKLSLRRPDE